METAEPEHFFDYSENWFDRLFALALNRSGRFGGHAFGHRHSSLLFYRGGVFLLGGLTDSLLALLQEFAKDIPYLFFRTRFPAFRRRPQGFLETTVHAFPVCHFR